MYAERRKEIEAAADDEYPEDIPLKLQDMLREVLDELDLREKQIAISRQLLGEIAGELGTFADELEGLKSDNQR